MFLKQPFFSMIIPYYNGADTIERALVSLLPINQGLGKESLEVIFVNDNSTDNFQEIINKYKNDLNIRLVNTEPREMHCPGNTRFDGMKYVKGKWVCFMDQDDFLEYGALNHVRSCIEACGEKYVIGTGMRSWNEVTDTFTNFDKKPTWLHGKFYNKKNFIDKFNVNFKENLYSHEDVYFNSKAINALYMLGKTDFNWDPFYTYRWVENPHSLTRSYRDNFNCYVEEHFEDYLVACYEPFIENAIKSKKENITNLYYNQIMMTILHAYFYYCSAVLRDSPMIEHVYETIKVFYRKFLKDFDITAKDIIAYVYEDPIRYNLVRDDSIMTSSFFVEPVAFRDWIMGLEENREYDKLEDFVNVL